MKDENCVTMLWPRDEKGQFASKAGYPQQQCTRKKGYGKDGEYCRGHAWTRGELTRKELREDIARKRIKLGAI